jgi:hypothetical protein
MVAALAKEVDVMAGRGPTPKPRGRRARANKDPVPLRVVTVEPIKQPPLPQFYLDRKRFIWPAHTRVWWAMWGASPLAAEFTATDWSELLDTAFLHAQYWRGDLKLAGELRLRVAKFGATPEDRARLRITFAQADVAEHDVAAKTASTRERRGAPQGGADTGRGRVVDAVAAI